MAPLRKVSAALMLMLMPQSACTMMSRRVVSETDEVHGNEVDLEGVEVG